MPKYTPKLPLLPDKTQPGFEHIEEIRDLARQNLKMVLLTNPGERVMIPEFGVGLSGMLFENFSDKDMLLDFEGRIIEQVNNYLPYVDLEEVSFDLVETDRNKIFVQVTYSIPEIDLVDSVSIGLAEE